MVILVLAAGLSLTGWAARQNRAREQRRIESEFRLESESLAQALEREMGLFLGVLSSLGELHTLSDRISPADFAEFTQKGLLHQKSVLGAFGFAQRIPLELRPAFESPAGPDETPTSLLEPGPDGFQPAGLRPHYFPLTYQSPAGGLGLPNGFDLAALPGQSESIARMASGGGPALGASVPAPSPEDGTGFLVGAPIGTGPAFTGFTVARLWPQTLLDRALRQMRVRHVQVTLFDPAYGRPPPAGAARYVIELPAPMADQEWVLRCEAGPDYQATRAASAWLFILVGGASATLLLAVLLALLAGRARAVERTVRERTAQLEEANRRLASEMDERARLETAMHTAGEREKQRIGQDLHDSLGQKLTGAVYLARALETDLQPAGREQAEKLVELLKDAVAQVRRTARGLAPLEVGEDGLVPGLRRLAEETCDVFNIACSFAESGPPAAHTPERSAHLYHIAQEAVNNAVRHGRAREIRIELTPTSLRVTDNGRGFDAAQTAAGAGLRIMRHRAQRIGGTLDITSSGQGTTLTVTLV